MKRLLQNLWDRLLVRLGFQHPSFKLMTWDGKTGLEMDGLRCRTCQNRFWVEDLTLEVPTFCCYCGTRFKKVEGLSNATFEEESASSN